MKNLVGNIFQETVAVAEPFSGQTDPLTRSRAWQANVVFLCVDIKQNLKKNSNRPAKGMCRLRGEHNEFTRNLAPEQV